MSTCDLMQWAHIAAGLGAMLVPHRQHSTVPGSIVPMGAGANAAIRGVCAAGGPNVSHATSAPLLTETQHRGTRVVERMSCSLLCRGRLNASLSPPPGSRRWPRRQTTSLPPPARGLSPRHHPGPPPSAQVTPLLLPPPQRTPPAPWRGQSPPTAPSGAGRRHPPPPPPAPPAPHPHGCQPAAAARARLAVVTGRQGPGALEGHNRRRRRRRWSACHPAQRPWVQQGRHPQVRWCQRALQGQAGRC